MSDLLDLLNGLANWPEAPQGNGPVRRAVDVVTAALAALLVAAVAGSLLIGVFFTRPWSAFLELATSILILAIVGFLGLFLLHLLAGLIAIGVDRLFATK